MMYNFGIGGGGRLLREPYKRGFIHRIVLSSKEDGKGDEVQ